MIPIMQIFLRTFKNLLKQILPEPTFNTSEIRTHTGAFDMHR